MTERAQTCGFCRQPGHNRRRCPELATPAAAAEMKSQTIAAFDQVGPPPTDPLKLAEWCCQVQAICLEETIRGRGDPRLSKEVRELAAGIARLIPADILSKAKGIVEGATSPKRSTKQKRGPEPTPVGGDAGDHRAVGGAPQRR